MSLFWQIAFRNLFRNGRRNLLTGASIAFGFIGISLLGGYILRMERYLAVQSVFLAGNGHVIVYAKNGLAKHVAEPNKHSLSPKDVEVLRNFANDPRVEFTAVSLKAGGLIYNGCQSYPFIASAMEPKALIWERSRPEIAEFVPELGKPTHGNAFWELDPKEQPVMISPRLSMILDKQKVFGEPEAVPAPGIPNCALKESRLALRNDPSVQLIGAAFEGGVALSDATVSGHVSTGMAFEDDTAVLMPYAMAQTMYQTDKTTAFSYFLKDESKIAHFHRDLEAYIHTQGLDFDVYPFYDERISAFYVGGMQFNYVMLCLFVVFVCTVVGISISNSLYISLLERKSELGTLRSLGFRQEQIRLLIVMENCILLVFSFIPAFATAYGLLRLVHHANIRILIPGLANDVQFRLFLTPWYLSLVTILISILVILVSYIGGGKYLKKPILELLGNSSC